MIMTVQIKKEIYLATHEEWRNWLEKNHTISDGVWLIYYKKQSGKPRIPYGEAVEEALCYGWIDGKIKKVNEDYYKQWFTPRRSGSRWSKLNIERVHRLTKEGRMKEKGLQAFSEVMEKPDLVYDNRPKGDLDIPPDLLEELKENEKALDNFNRFSQSAQQLYLLWLNDAKRAETRLRRIARIVDLCEKNIRPGMM
jgi:uncharacterized protein YdeI (YjbR/CyaY-like superfamily)